jgi:hypothetical protein
MAAETPDSSSKGVLGGPVRSPLSAWRSVLVLVLAGWAGLGRPVGEGQRRVLTRLGRSGKAARAVAHRSTRLHRHAPPGARDGDGAGKAVGPDPRRLRFRPDPPAGSRRPTPRAQGLQGRAARSSLPPECRSAQAPARRPLAAAAADTAICRLHHPEAHAFRPATRKADATRPGIGTAPCRSAMTATTDPVSQPGGCPQTLTYTPYDHVGLRWHAHGDRWSRSDERHCGCALPMAARRAG